MDRDYNKETKERHKRYREMHPDYMGNWYKNNPNYRLEYGRRYRMSRKQKSMEYAINRNYNLSIDQYNKILNYQENKCAICKRPFETTN